MLRRCRIVAGVAFFVLSASVALSEVVPPNLPAGSKYQLLFATSDGTR